MKTFLNIFIITFLLSTLAQADRGLQLKKMKEEQRVALVIGNNNYSNLSRLKNPINDARVMKNVLKNRGFDVIYKENASKRDMKKLLKNFAYKLKSGGVGLYYFAGHGVSVDGHNFLVGTDSLMDDKDEVEYETLALNYITKKMKAANNRLNIIILDACRNDPFARGGSGGLAPVSNARGMLVAYATEAGSVASDGKSGKNGVFTKYLVKNMKEKGATIERVFKNTRADVFDATSGKQSPGVYNQIRGDFYFTLPSTIIVKQKPKRKQSSFDFQDDLSQTHSIRINQTPSDAKVSIVNIKQKFKNGMKLVSGNYDIKVSKLGYYTKTGNINLQNDVDIDIQLKKKVKQTSLKSSFSTPAPREKKKSSSGSSINQNIKELYGDEFGKLSQGQQQYIIDNQKIMRRITQQILSRVTRVNLPRDMNVNARNVIEFYLHPNGDMSDFRFIKKSKYYVLDDTTKETISYAYSRYPRPKEKTLIRYNVYYNLARY